MTQRNYRYRAAICRRAMFEPVEDEALLERITVHAPDASTARLCIQHLTGAAHVFDAERLDEVAIVPSPTHLYGTAVFA
jgi:hypothetical protein